MSNKPQVILYTDGACSGNPGPGGYAAILVAHNENGQVLGEKEIVGEEETTTNNRMEMMAVIQGLSALTKSTEVKIVSDSEYVIKTMTLGWKRKKNTDLWPQIDALCATHKVTWEYVRGHNGHEYNERCDKLAVAAYQKFLK
jgi:ribonuclease HI